MHIIKWWGVLLLSVLTCGIVSAQRPTDANITGHIIDKNSKEHIPYVTVSLKGTTYGSVVDASGHYFLKNLPEGTYTIVASGIGYDAQEKEVVLRGHKTIEINFELAENTIQMDQVVVSANRQETNRREAPTIVNVVSTKLFESTASNNLADALNYQPGLRVEYNCSNCGVPQLRINGLEGQYSQILLDSRPIFSSLANVYGLEQLPVSMVERVEVIRGGGSALFGANAIGGVVNIITKEPVRNSLTLSNNTQYIDGAWDTNTSLNGSFVSDDYRAGLYLFGMIRDREEYDRNGDGFSEIPKLESETIGFRSYYKTSAYSKLTAEYHHIREFRRGGDQFERPPHEVEIAEQLRHKIDGGGLKIDLWSRDFRHRGNVYTSAQNINRDSFFGTSENPEAYGKTSDVTFVAGGQYTYGFNKLLFLPSDLTAGIEYNMNHLNDKMLGYSRLLDQTSRTFGGFLQNEWKSEKFNLLVGARIDKNNLMDDVVLSPRANIRYTPVKNVILRTSYSSGYRAPQAYDEDLHVEAVGGVVKLIELDPDLKPEYSNSFSTSVDLYHRFGRLQANLLMEGFYTRLKDIFFLEDNGYDDLGNELFIRTNAGKAIVKGINAELSLNWPKVGVQMGYTLQNSKYNKAQEIIDNTEAQRRMVRTPDNYGYFVMNYAPWKRFNVSLSGNYTGSMYVPHEMADPLNNEIIRSKKFFDAGFKLAYTIPVTRTANLELNGGMKNLFDSYQKNPDWGADKDAGFIYGPSMPRTYFFGVKITL